jgi:hypothetical protein
MMPDMESYLIRIYRCGPETGDGIAGILIDIASNQQYPFRNLAEMNAVLRQTGERQPHGGQRTDTGGVIENYLPERK